MISQDASPDRWEARFQATVAQRLSSHEALLVLDLLREDEERFEQALLVLGHDAAEAVLGRTVDGRPVRAVAASEDVSCECGDAGCGCTDACTTGATFEWGGVDAGDWLYLCYACAFRLIERGSRYGDGEEVAGDA